MTPPRRRIPPAARRALAVATIFFAALGVRPAAAQSTPDADSAALRRYTLTMPKIEAWMAANHAMAAEARARAAAGDTVQDDDDASNDNESLDQMAARLDRQPLMHKAIKGAGLTAREYSLIMLTLMQAMMADAAMRQYPTMKRPDINVANLEFVKAHRAKLEAALKGTEGDGSQD